MAVAEVHRDVAHLRARAGLAVVERDLHARHAALDQLVRVGDHADVRVLGLDRGHRSGDGAPALGGVAGRDDLLERDGLRLELELEVDRRVSLHGGRQSIRAVAEHRHRHLMAADGNILNDETSVRLREGSEIRALDGDGRTGNRPRGAGLHHPAGDRAGLRVDAGGESGKETGYYRDPDEVGLCHASDLHVGTPPVAGHAAPGCGMRMNE